MTESLRKKRILSWALYDWANSAFSTTVMAGFFPVFFKQYWSAGADATVTTAKLGTALSVSSLLIAILSPTLGVMADLRGSRKFFCAFFMLVACASCVWMAFIPMGGWGPAMIAYGLSMMAFAASAVFYDAMLPSVARGREMDRASALGYSLGYLGGGVLFAINVVMYLKPTLFGFADGVAAVKASFVSVAVWWILFSIPLFRNVPEPASEVTRDNLWRLTAKSLAGLKKTASALVSDRNLFFFMAAYWLYIDGVYTVMSMAVDFGLALGLESSHLISALLLTQFVGFPFAWLFGRLTSRFGCRRPILFCIGVYALAVVAAMGMNHVAHFYALAALIGMVQGGVQALSRSLFARMVPQGRAAEFFGLYNLIGKFASIVGPLLVAATVMVTGESRMGMTGLLVLFGLGGILLWKVKEPEDEAHPRPAGAP